MLCVTSAGVVFLPELRQRMFPNGISPWMPLAGIGPFVLFELVALTVLRYRLAVDRDFPQAARFLKGLPPPSGPRRQGLDQGMPALGHDEASGREDVALEKILGQPKRIRDVGMTVLIACL